MALGVLGVCEMLWPPLNHVWGLESSKGLLVRYPTFKRDSELIVTNLCWDLRRIFRNVVNWLEKHQLKLGSICPHLCLHMHLDIPSSVPSLDCSIRMLGGGRRIRVLGTVLRVWTSLMRRWPEDNHFERIKLPWMKGLRKQLTTQELSAIQWHLWCFLDSLC